MVNVTARGTQQPQEFLDQRKVDYIFLGPREQELGDLPAGVRLTEVYHAEGVAVYAVPHGQ
jgi:hypothetical protein